MEMPLQDDEAEPPRGCKMIAGFLLTAVACGSLAHSPILPAAARPSATDGTPEQILNSFPPKELSSLPGVGLGSAALLDAGRKTASPAPKSPTEAAPAPAPACLFTPLPLGQEAAKLPPLPCPPPESPESVEYAKDSGLDGEQVGDFCPLPPTRHATKTAPSAPSSGLEVVDQHPPTAPGNRPAGQLVPVQHRRVITEMQPRWVLTHTVARTSHGYTVTRPAWVQMMQPVRREVIETTWVPRTETDRVEPSRRTPALRVFIVRRHTSRPQSGSTFLRVLSRLWTASP
jgi:hypothetical protein